MGFPYARCAWTSLCSGHTGGTESLHAVEVACVLLRCSKGGTRRVNLIWAVERYWMGRDPACQRENESEG